MKGVSELIINADDMIQGLKRHWFLRSAFKNDEKEEEEERRREAGEPEARRVTPAPKAGKWR